jgi:hypothetical protein
VRAVLEAAVLVEIRVLPELLELPTRVVVVAVLVRSMQMVLLVATAALALSLSKYLTT